MKAICLATLAAAALLAGCSGEKSDADGDGKVSIGEAAKVAEAEGVRPEPGLYKTTVTMTALEIPGMPPEMKDHGAGLVRTFEDCLTAEEVEKGFEAMVKQGQDGECAYENFALAGGKLDAVLVCKAQGRAIRTSMSGTANQHRRGSYRDDRAGARRGGQGHDDRDGQARAGRGVSGQVKCVGFVTHVTIN